MNLFYKFAKHKACVFRWLGFRLELLGNFLILAATMFAVSSRDVITGGLVGLSISYALEVRTANQIHSNTPFPNFENCWQ